jgi:hypothetical protein
MHVRIRLYHGRLSWSGQGICVHFHNIHVLVIWSKNNMRNNDFLRIFSSQTSTDIQSGAHFWRSRWDWPWMNLARNLEWSIGSRSQSSNLYNVSIRIQPRKELEITFPPQQRPKRPQPVTAGHFALATTTIFSSSVTYGPKFIHIFMNTSFLAMFSSVVLTNHYSSHEPCSTCSTPSKRASLYTSCWIGYPWKKSGTTTRAFSAAAKRSAPCRVCGAGPKTS